MTDALMVKMWALTLLAGLEGLALYLGLDGALFLPVVGIIAGLAGYEVGKVAPYQAEIEAAANAAKK